MTAAFPHNPPHKMPQTLPRPVDPALPPVSRVLIGLGLLLADWDLRRRTRASLLALDAHLIRDIGLDPMVAEIEGHKPFWRT